MAGQLKAHEMAEWSQWADTVETLRGWWLSYAKFVHAIGSCNRVAVVEEDLNDKKTVPDDTIHFDVLGQRCYMRFRHNLRHGFSEYGRVVAGPCGKDDYSPVAAVEFDEHGQVFGGDREYLSSPMNVERLHEKAVDALVRAAFQAPDVPRLT